MVAASVSHARHRLAVVDLRVRRPLDVQDTQQTALGACERMIHQGVVSGRSPATNPAGRNKGGEDGVDCSSKPTERASDASEAKGSIVR